MKKELHIGIEEDENACVVFPNVDAFKIREYRRSKNLTQEKFAYQYGINVRTLKRWEGESESVPRFSSAFRKILSDWLSGGNATKPQTGQ